MDAVIVDSATLDPAAVMEEAAMEWAIRYFEDGYFKASFSDTVTYLEHVVKGNLIYVDGQTYRIDQVQRVTEENGSVTWTVSGLTMALLADRLALPPAGLSHDVQEDVEAETAIKHYVDANMGPGAAAARQMPGLTIGPDLARGPIITAEARYQTLKDIVFEIAITSALGWRCSFDPNDEEFLFDIVEGEDRTATVFFDVDFETALKTNMLSTDFGRANYAYVAGQGEGAARTIIERFTGVAEPTGLARRELFVDARDLQANESLEMRGDAKLAETEQEDVFELDANPYGSFRLDEHWFVGDLVTVRNRLWGVQATSRIVGVIKRSTGGSSPDLSVEIGQPWPTIQRKLVKEVSKARAGDLV